MPVGTRGAVRHLASNDLEALGAEVILANTYHLMLRPGAEVIAAMGGIHRFVDFNNHVLTDSGGFQVFSLKPQIDDDGATFRSVYGRLDTPADAAEGCPGSGSDRRGHPDGARRLSLGGC